ncbi:B-cell receptor CD22-like [Notolabrus celidotus]|uniref:B-cell receptor CD22-like n=1 Tax=Notolabrus celidotus TaxID=1203425 RepID=UPI0014907B32|nr:B-cell receptor CD22-like [Notolabrus celidotus]
MSYIWFKNGKEIPNEEKSSHEDRFYPGDLISCAVKGLEKSVSPSVYALKAPSVSVSPPGEITNGSSVTLKCSSDANREANYTWLKRNQTLPREEPQLVFTSTQPSDSGEYRCTSENELGKRTSEPVFIDVKYAPQLPSVSVSPSGEIMEGSSVNLTCSSDANPAANYTWYKENEDSPKAVGPVFIITESRAEHSGNYYCEVHNGIGRQNSTLLLIVVAGAWTSTAVGTSLAVVFVILLLVVFILIRKKRASKRSAENGETAGDTQEQCLPPQSTQEEQDLHYSIVQFITNPEPESLYSCIRPVQPESLYSCVRPVQQHGHQLQENQDVVYAAVTINKPTSALS